MSNAIKDVTVNGATLNDAIETLDNQPRAVAYRAIANSALSAAVRHAEIHLRMLANPNNDYTGIDRFNEEMAEADEKAASREQLDSAGIEQRVYNPLLEAQASWALYNYAKERCLVTQGKHDAPEHRSFLARQQSRQDYDAPMQLQQMVDLMVTPTLSNKQRAAAQFLSNEFDIPLDTLHEMQRMRNEMKGTELEQSREDITALLESFTEYAHESTMEELDVVTTFRLAVKVVQKLWAAWWRVFNNALERGDLSDTGNLPLLKAAADDIESWLDAFSTQHYQALDEAAAGGAVLNPPEDRDNKRPRDFKAK